MSPAVNAIRHPLAIQGANTRPRNQANATTLLVFPDPADRADERARKRATEARGISTKLFEIGRGNNVPRVKGTLWAAYNGVTEYIDHYKGRADRSRHLDSIWFGDGYLTKARAFRIAIEQAKQWQN